MNLTETNVQVTVIVRVRSPQELNNKTLRNAAVLALSLSPTPTAVSGLTDYPVEVFVTSLEAKVVR